MASKLSKRQEAYLNNKSAKVGDMITCPICGEVFKKKQYSQAFCCKQCKDTFWNNKRDRHCAGYYADYDSLHPERIERAIDLGYYKSPYVCVVGGCLTPSAEKELYEDDLENVFVSGDFLDDDFCGGEFIEND